MAAKLGPWVGTKTSRREVYVAGARIHFIVL